MYLKPSNQKVKPRKIFGFDIETYGEDNKFLMGSIVGANHSDSEGVLRTGFFKKVFWNQKEMQHYFLNSHDLRESYVFATNLNFDFTALFNMIDDFYKFQFILRNTSFISVKLNRNNHSWVMLDTLNFLKVSVAALGKIIGTDKLDKPDFLGKTNKLTHSQRIELEKYNINDSYITYKFAEFCNDIFNSLGTNMKYTIASTALSLFKNKYLKINIKQPSKDIIKDMYKGYYGGRTEVFFRGKIKSGQYYDVNSLYPYVMHKYKYPNPNTLIKDNNSNINLINDYEGLSYCKINTDNVNDFCKMYPLLPLKHDGKLIFPLGKFEGWYSHCELRKALELGYKVIPMKTYYYTETFNIFKDYVNDMYEGRLKNKNTKFEIVYKILMNSLYGKFAQHLYHTEILFPQNIDINKYHKENIKRIKEGEEIRFKIDIPAGIEKINSKGEHIEIPLIYYIMDLDLDKYPKFINPILSIYTTAYARLELYEYFEQIYYKGGNVLYCDTDSVITDKYLETGKKLGEMKLELDIEKGILIKPKFYYLKGKDDIKFIKCKGLMNLGEESFFELLKTGKYEYMKFTKFKESIRRDIAFNKKIEVIKDIDFTDNKRIWETDEITEELQISKPISIEYNSVPSNPPL